MVFKKIIFQNSYVALETPSGPPPFMANTILNSILIIGTLPLPAMPKLSKSSSAVKIVFSFQCCQRLSTSSTLTTMSKIVKQNKPVLECLQDRLQEVFEEGRLRLKKDSSNYAKDVFINILTSSTLSCAFSSETSRGLFTLFSLSK